MMPSPMNPTRSIFSILRGAAVPAGTRRLDTQPVTGAQPPRRLGRQLFAVEEVAPGPARRAPVRPRRRVAPALGDQGVLHLLERLDLAHDAVAAAKAARAPASAAHRVLDDAQRELELERLH